MGGRDGIRGYYFQILASLIELAMDDTWDSVRVEPDTENDKVDIVWLFKSRIKCVQVKSSINNFERHHMINWILYLVTDSKQSYNSFGLDLEYELYLIGTTDGTADGWISDFRNKKFDFEKVDKKLKEVEGDLPIVTITKNNFDLESLESKAYVKMMEYLERSRGRVSIEIVKSLCSEIVDNLFKSSLKGISLNKTMFFGLISKHIDMHVTTNENHSDLKMLFYKKNQVVESETMNEIALDKSPYLGKLVESAMNSITIIKNTKLDNLIEFNRSEGTIEVGGVTINLNPLPFSWSPVKIEKEERDSLIRMAKEYLNIELFVEDFNLGNLVKRNVATLGLYKKESVERKGTKEEESKYYSISNALYKLTLFKYFSENFFRDIAHKYRPIPLLLKNLGDTADNKINITLEFPNTVRIITPEILSRGVPNVFIEHFLDEREIFDVLLLPEIEARVFEFESFYLNAYFMAVQIKSIRSDNVYTQTDLENHFASLFNYELHQDREATVIKYTAKSLQACMSMTLPTFILVEADYNFDIKYHISSDKLKRPVEGILHWKRIIANAEDKNI